MERARLPTPTHARFPSSGASLFRQGTVFGPFRLLELVARGGMAEVYRALRPLDHAPSSPGLCAIKRIRPELVEHRDAQRMFADEARIMALLDHPNIVRSHGWGRVGNVPYLAMELLEGLTLAKVWRAIARTGESFPVELAAYVVREMAIGLDHAHGAGDEQGRPLGLVHRDVSPSNVMLQKSGEVKLIDFGVAKSAHRLREQWTRADVVKGKVCYMSPEQLRSLPLDGRSDLFALGVTLWELLAGRHLFHQASPKEAAAMVLGGAIPPIESLRHDLPPGLSAVMAGALSRDRDHRYPTGAAVAVALDPFCPPRSQAAHAIALLVHASRGLGARSRTTEALSAVSRRSTPGSLEPAGPEAGSSGARSMGSAPTTPRTLGLRGRPAVSSRPFPGVSPHVPDSPVRSAGPFGRYPTSAGPPARSTVAASPATGHGGLHPGSRASAAAAFTRPPRPRRPYLRHALQILVLALLSFGAGVLWQRYLASAPTQPAMSPNAPLASPSPEAGRSRTPPPWHPTGPR